MLCVIACGDCAAGAQLPVWTSVAVAPCCCCCAARWPGAPSLPRRWTMHLLDAVRRGGTAADAPHHRRAGSGAHPVIPSCWHLKTLRARPCDAMVIFSRFPYQQLLLFAVARPRLQPPCCWPAWPVDGAGQRAPARGARPRCSRQHRIHHGAAGHAGHGGGLCLLFFPRMAPLWARAQRHHGRPLIFVGPDEGVGNVAETVALDDRTAFRLRFGHDAFGYRPPATGALFPLARCSASFDWPGMAGRPGARGRGRSREHRRLPARLQIAAALRCATRPPWSPAFAPG